MYHKQSLYKSNEDLWLKIAQAWIKNKKNCEYLIASYHYFADKSEGVDVFLTRATETIALFSTVR